MAYLTVGNVKLAQKICDGLEGRKFDGKTLRTEFTLGKPCRDVYVAGVGGMEGWRVREVMEEWGEVLRVEGKYGDRKGEKGGKEGGTDGGVFEFMCVCA